MSSPSSTPRRSKTPSPVQAKKSPKDKTNNYQNVLSNVIKEGILQRKKIFGWVKYRYVLRENDLRRYSTKAYRNAMKIYPINSDCHIQQTGDCEFTVKHKKHTLHLKAKTPRERDDWVEALHTQTIDGSQIFISKEAQAEKSFRDNQEQRKRRVSAKRNSVIANLQTYDKREVGSPKPLTQLDSVATNIKHTRGRMKSLSAGSSEDVDVGRLSPELNAVNTPIDTTQRAYLRRRSRSIIRSSTVEAWDEDDVEKTKRENDDKVKKTKKQPMDYKSLGIKLTCGLLAALLLFYFSYYALYVTWYGYRVTAVITYYTIWCSIIFPIVLYFSGNILLRMLFNIPGLNFVDPELAFHFDIGKQRLKIVNLTLLKKSIQFLGIESNGLQFQSLSIQEISLCFPVTNALKGISIGIGGIYANIKPLSRGDWEVVKDGYISSDKALSKYLADATVAALDAKLKIFKATMEEKNKALRGVHTPIASWKIMVDDIIDTLELTIQNTAIRIVAPTRNHEAEIGIEISKIGLAKVKGENREKRLRVFAIEDLCIRANYNEKKGEDEVTSEENKNKNNATFEEKVDQNNDGRNVADHYDDEIFDPITISISLALPPVMQVLMEPLANLEEGVEKNIITSIEISSIHLKLNPIHFKVISIITEVMAQYTTYQNKQYVKYKNSMVSVRRNEIATYKTNYRKFKAPNASKSEKQTLQTQLSTIEERMTHDQIILARWDAENWEIPSLRKFAHAESMLTNEQKMLVLQDFLYNRPMLDYSLDNRIEENSKMMDCVLLTLHLDNIILDVHNSKVKEEGFSVCVDEVSVHARLHLIERNHESIATSAKISVKRLQLENFQEKQFELQYPSTICKHVSDTDDSFSNLIVIDYMAYFSGRSDIKVSLKGLNLIIGARTLEIIMSSVNSLLEPFSTSSDVPSSKNDDEEVVVDISNDKEPDPSFMEEETISGGFMGGSDIMVNISVKNINIFLLENVHEVVPAAFVFTLNLQAGIDSSLREETISLELKDTSFRQCVVNSHDEKVGTSHWHSVQFKYSRAASLLDFAGDDVDLCAYVHSYSDVNSRDGEHSVFLKMEDLDIKLSISQIFTLNSYIANVTDAIGSDEDPAKKSKEMQMEKARRTQIIKELSNKRKQQMLDSFESIDEDNDGVLTLGEFERMLMTSFPNKLLNSEYKNLTFTMFTILDEDDDSEISFEEFKSAMEDNTLFEAYCDINLKCHEYAGSDFVVPGQKQNTIFLNRIPSLSIVSNRSTSLSSGGQNSGKQKQRNVDEKEQEDRFWDILMKEGVVNREKSIQGQNLIDVQRKMVRACQHYEYARYAWMNYLSPALIEKQEIDYGRDEIWQLKPSSDSGAINVKDLFNVVNTYTGEQRNISTDTVARAAKPFRMAMSVTMDIGGIYISLIDLNIPMPVPALEIVVDSIEVDLSSRYNEDHDIDVWKGHIYCLLYANYYNNLSCHQEPLIENAPISIMLSEYSPKNKQNHANHVHVDGDVDSESEDEEAEEDILDSSFIGDVVNEENRPPVTMVEVAVAPLRINGSLMLTQLIDELNKAFAGHAVSSYDNLRHSNDIGDYGGFYILNNLKEKMSVTCLKEDVTLKRLRTSTSNSTTLPSSFVDRDGVGQKDEIEEKSNDVVESSVVTGNGVKTNNDALMDPKNTVTTASSDLCPCPFLTKTINGASSLKQKSIRNTFNKYDDDDTGLITCSEGEEVMYDILNIFKIPFEGHEDTIRDAIEKADDNMSRQISMLEFNDAVAILIKKLGMNKNRYTLNIHGFHYSNIQTPINSQTFAYECDALKDNGKVDAMSAIVIQHEERSEVGTVLRFKSILTITHKLHFQTDKEYLNIMLKLGDESKVFKLNKEVDSLHVPFKWVSAKTQMLIQFTKDENWRAIGVKKGGFQFLEKKSVGYDPIFATGIDGANVLLTHLPADNNVDIKLWTISILPQIKFRNDLPVPIFIKVNHNVHGQDEQDQPIISVKGGSVASVYGIDVGNYTNVDLKIALYRPSKRKKKRRKEYIVENKVLVEEDLPEGIKFSQDARFKINKDKIASSPHVGFKIAGEVNESIRIDGEWLNDDAPMILLSSLFWFKNLTGLPLECKLKTQKTTLADDDGGEQIQGEKVNFQLTGENYIFIDKPTEGATLKCKIKPYDRKKSKKMIHAEYADNTKTFTEYTEMYAGYWYEAYGRIPKNSKIRTKTGIFNFYTFPLWEPMNMYMPVTILPMYVVQNNLPFPIDVFAGNLFRDNRDNEEHACFNLKPGENCPIYRFFNLRKGDGPKVAIRATNREGSVLTWNEPVPIVYNENLVGESKFLYVQKDSNPNNRSICRASIGFDETGYNYNTIFLCFDIAKAPYRIENRSCTQTLFYWQYKHEHDIREILPMQYRDFVLPHPSGKPIICVAQAKAAKGEKKMEAKDLQSTRVDVDKIDTLYQVRGAKHHCYFKVKADGFVKVLCMGDSHYVAIEDEEHAVEELMLSKNYRLDLQIGAIIIAVADIVEDKDYREKKLPKKYPRELVEISLNEIQLQVYNNSWRLKMVHLQADDLRVDTQLPAVIEPVMTGYNTCRIPGYDPSMPLIPALEVKYDYFKPLGSTSDKVMVKSGIIEIADLNLNVELGYIMNNVCDTYWKLNLFYPLPLDLRIAAIDELNRACAEMVKPYLPSQSDEMTYFEFFGMPAFRISLSLLNNVETDDKSQPGGLSSILGKGLGGVLGGVVGDLDINISLSQIKRKNEFLTQTDMIWDTINSYTRDIQRQILQIVFHAEIFGDVMGLAEGLQLGFKSAGENLMKGKGLSAIKKMGMTVGQGAVGGAFNTLGHVTNAAGNTVKKITNFTDMEEKEDPAWVGQGISQGMKVLGKSIAQGVAGIVMQPYKGAKAHGPKGFVKGLAKGVMSLPAGFVIGGLGFVEKVAVGVNNTTHLRDQMFLVGTRRPYRTLLEQKGDGSHVIHPIKSVLECPETLSGVMIYIRSCIVAQRILDEGSKRSKYYLKIEAYDMNDKGDEGDGFDIVGGIKSGFKKLSSRSSLAIGNDLKKASVNAASLGKNKNIRKFTPFFSKSTPAKPALNGMIMDTNFTIDMSKNFVVREDKFTKTVYCTSVPKVWFEIKLFRKRVGKKDDLCARKTMFNTHITEQFMPLERDLFTHLGNDTTKAKAWNTIQAKEADMYGNKSGGEKGGWISLSDPAIDIKQGKRSAPSSTTFVDKKEILKLREGESFQDTRILIDGVFWRERNHTSSKLFMDLNKKIL